MLLYGLFAEEHGLARRVQQSVAGEAAELAKLERSVPVYVILFQHGPHLRVAPDLHAHVAQRALELVRVYGPGAVLV